MSHKPFLSFRLSKSTAVVLLEITERCLHCSSENDYQAIFGLLNQIIPLELATSGLARLDKNSTVSSYELLNISYPSEWLLLYNKNNFSAVDVIVKEHFTNFTPQYWGDTYKLYTPSRNFTKLATDFGLRYGYTCGSRPFGYCQKASLFSLAGDFTKYSPEIVGIIQRVAPHIHLAASYTLEMRKRLDRKRLVSPREIEVLNWLRLGKSSWEISAILGVSESTVNFHIYRIMQKLDSVNRPQAVAAAVHLGLIDLD